jgi:hypothetical protein
VLKTLNVEYPQDWLDGIALQNIDEQDLSTRMVFTKRISYAVSEPRNFAGITKDIKIIKRKKQMAIYNLKEDPEEKINLFEEQINHYDFMESMTKYYERSLNVQNNMSILKMDPLY